MGLHRHMSKVGTTAALAAAALAVGCASSGAHTASSSSVNAKKLPVGDGKVTASAARRGYVYSCTANFMGGGAFKDGSWFNGDGTWDSTKKAFVDGAVSWAQARVSIKEGSGALAVSSNALPKGSTTGRFPISSSDDAYEYDRNPNSIAGQNVSYSLPAKPEKASKPGCLSGGMIGVATNGVPIFDALDAGGEDAVAHEIQDSCHGHPQQQSLYHYHDISKCLTKGDSTTAHSKLVGYALDGFPVYGPRGDGGQKLTNADLDACHGHTGWVTLRGKRVRIYHYHATSEYPYTIGCYHGTPVSTGQGNGGGGQMPSGPPPGA